MRSHGRKSAITLTLTLLFLLPGWMIAGSRDADQSKRPIQLQDILDWKSIGAAAVSDDGQWFAYRLSPVEGDSQMVVRSVSGETEHRFEIGDSPAGGGRGGFGRPSSSVAFSPDSHWLAFTVYPAGDEASKARKAKKKTYNKVALVELANGEKTEFEKVRAFSFSGENPGWLALHKYPAENQGSGKDKWDGSNLILRDLTSGTEQNIGNVSEYGFNKAGTLLAWLVDAEGKSGNGVQLRRMDSGTTTPLDSGEASYKALNWTKEGDAFAVLKGMDSDDYEEALYSLIGFKDFDREAASRASYDPSTDESFPEGMTISPDRDPSWSEDLAGILFGIHEVEKKEKKGGRGGSGDQAASDDNVPSRGRRGAGAGDEDEQAKLVIWHWKDDRMQSQQQVQEQRDKRFSYLCAYWIADNRFVRLADDHLRQIAAAPKQHWGLGTDNTPYELNGNLDGRRYEDIYAVNLRTGERRLAVEKSRWNYGPSPDGKRFFHYRDGNFFVYDMPSGSETNVTGKLPVRFIDIEDDHNVKDPPTRPLGWTSDSAYLLLTDDWDIWKVSTADGSGVNLTVNGKKSGIRYNRHYQLDPDEEGIDLSDAYFRAYGEWTKKEGIIHVADGKPDPGMLVWDDATFSLGPKAKNANVYLFTRDDFDSFPDYYAAGPDLKDAHRLTDANTQQDDFLWSSGSRLVDYTSDKGVRHQAALFLPANYEEGTSYPTIVYIYERLSQGLNNYYSPSANGFNKSVYTSNGYAVLMPDISYTVDDPGRSAVWCVLPALKAAIATGVVDADHVGLHGHSWGGYQTAFLVTQTHAFAAAVAGAPLTNMISMYSSIYWNTGSANQPIFESSQGRFSGGYWEVPEAYARNSPVYFAQNVTTPLIILHNDKDGAVDWNQGIEYFNTLRRLGKPVVMLQYEGENHGLRQEPNRKDYTIRMREFFDHHLKGAPAPEWLESGVPHLKLEDHLKERAKLIKKRPAKEAEAKKEEKKGTPDMP